MNAMIVLSNQKVHELIKRACDLARDLYQNLNFEINEIPTVIGPNDQPGYIEGFYYGQLAKKEGHKNAAFVPTASNDKADYKISFAFGLMQSCRNKDRVWDDTFPEVVAEPDSANYTFLFGVGYYEGFFSK